MDEPQNTMLSESFTGKSNTMFSHLYAALEQAKLACGNLLGRGVREISVFSILIGVWVTGTLVFVKTQQMVHLRCLQFNVCKFYLKKKAHEQILYSS